MRTMMWLRKGLRMHDQPALLAACDGASTVFPVYVLDRWHSNPDNIGDTRFEFIMESLRDLDKSLRDKGVEQGIIFLRGEPEKLLPKVWKALEVEAIAFDDSEENEVHSRKTDEQICKLAKEHKLELRIKHSHMLHSPDRYRMILDGKPVPTTMGEFQKLFQRASPVPEPLDEPDKVPFDKEHAKSAISALAKALDVKEDAFSVPSASDTAFYSDMKRSRAKLRFNGGETAALDRLEKEIKKRPAYVANFEKPKTAPNALKPDTTVMSPYLNAGCLSVRTLYFAIDKIYKDKKGKHTSPPVSLLGQVLWRELWLAIGALSGQDLSKMKGNALCRQIDWDDSKANLERLDKWAKGQTGFPFIDAIMTQLRNEGWMHHLARHAVACFATRGDLYAPWYEAAKVFDRYLIDADWSVNNCNWMWLSCSAFFYQYFRCYSPIAFGKKTDPDGDFIRKYVPALKKFPSKYIYEPWKAPVHVQEKAGCIIGKDYPKPIIDDHTATSKKNMSRIGDAYKANKSDGTDKPQPKKTKRPAEGTPAAERAQKAVKAS